MFISTIWKVFKKKFIYPFYTEYLSEKYSHFDVINISTIEECETHLEVYSIKYKEWVCHLEYKDIILFFKNLREYYNKNLILREGLIPKTNKIVIVFNLSVIKKIGIINFYKFWKLFPFEVTIGNHIFCEYRFLI
jgi:hypothetical protein